MVHLLAPAAAAGWQAVQALARQLSDATDRSRDGTDRVQRAVDSLSAALERTAADFDRTAEALDRKAGERLPYSSLSMLRMNVCASSFCVLCARLGCRRIGQRT